MTEILKYFLERHKRHTSVTSKDVTFPETVTSVTPPYKRGVTVTSGVTPDEGGGRKIKKPGGPAPSANSVIARIWRMMGPHQVWTVDELARKFPFRSRTGLAGQMSRAAKRGRFTETQNPEWTPKVVRWFRRRDNPRQVWRTWRECGHPRWLYRRAGEPWW